MIWTTKVDGVDKIMAAHINPMETWQLSPDLMCFKRAEANKE